MTTSKHTTSDVSETFIPSKDASLESSIQTLSQQLETLGFHIEERSWLNDIEGIWSVHISDRDCKRLFSNGKGASQLAARASALGEFFERLSTNYFWTHFYLGERIANAEFVHYPNEKWFALHGDAWPKGLLTKKLQKFYNPGDAVLASQLIDLNSGNAARGICAIPYTRLSDDKQVYFPVNLIGNLYVSNGMSAGNTLMEARTQALSEIFERDIKFKIIRDGICLPDVPESVIARYPRIAAGIGGLRKAGFGIVIKDASLGGKYPVMCVTLLHPENQGLFASFGAHPQFEVALERALTELLQGRALDSLDEFPAPSFDLDEVTDASNIELHFIDSTGVVSWDFLRDTPDVEFVDWNFSQKTEQDYQWCVNTLHGMGKEIYVADFQHLGVYACRILVPGMSEIYPIDELQWENNSIGNAVRPALLQLQDLSKAQSKQLLKTLLSLDLPDELAITTLIGLAAEPDSVWKALRMGELKTLAALACGHLDEALEGCAWIAQFGQLPAQRLRVYRCIATLIQLDDVAPFAQHVTLLFGEDTVTQAQALLQRKQQYVGLNNLGVDMHGSRVHEQLLLAYDKVWAGQRTA